MDSNIFNGGLVLIVLRGYCEAAKEDEKEKMLPERKEAPSDGKAGQSNEEQSSVISSNCSCH